MKAVLYAVKRDSGWEARVSVAWELDRSYWTDPGFRKRAAAGWQADDREDAAGWRAFSEEDSRYALMGVNPPLPLGIAVMARDRWETQAGKGAGRDPHRELLAAAKWAAIKAGETEATGLLDRLDVLEWRDRRNTAERRAAKRTEFLVEESEATQWDPLESELVDRGSGNEAAAAWTGTERRGAPLSAAPGGDVRWPNLPRHAREAADRLRGCGLLLAEAVAALDAEEATLLPVLQLASLFGGLRLASAVGPVQRLAGFGWFRGGAAEMHCRRCGSRGAALHRTPCAACGRQSCAYCEACLTMGRSRECGLLVIGAPVAPASVDCLQSPRRQTPNAACVSRVDPSLRSPGPILSPHLRQTLGKLSAGRATTPRVPARWGLSPAQQEAAETALAYLLRHRYDTVFREKLSVENKTAGGFRFLRMAISTPRAARSEFLLWAVTGAGKTEMMFPLLEAVLSAGGKAAVATPRRDVVLELAPRLAAAFPHVRLVVLYGGSEDRLRIGDLTLATTHQLIRFKEAFDLVVIDEVDAFPFHNDPALHFAAAEARGRGGMTLLLSATPPAAMQRRARQGRLPHARVAVRHHRRPLPVPQRLTIPPLSRWASASPNPGSDRLPAKLREAIRVSLHRGAQLFVFVPFIRQVEPLVQLLRQCATTFGIDPSAMDGTSSRDPQRGDKVTAFRGRSIRLLVTTTILERGVTVPKSDVFVLDADKPLFDAASLVQMAGRAGRSADDPAGRVIFAASAWTNSQRGACRQIREMNAYARRKGFLLETNEDNKR